MNYPDIDYEAGDALIVQDLNPYTLNSHEPGVPSLVPAPAAILAARNHAKRALADLDRGWGHVADASHALSNLHQALRQIKRPALAKALLSPILDHIQLALRAHERARGK